MFPGSKSVPAVESKYVVKELFATVEFGDHTKPILFHDGLFHAQYGTNSHRDGLYCMAMYGNIKWTAKRNANFDIGSMILADGMLLVRNHKVIMCLKVAK